MTEVRALQAEVQALGVLAAGLVEVGVAVGGAVGGAAQFLGEGGLLEGAAVAAAAARRMQAGRAGLQQAQEKVSAATREAGQN